MMLVTATRINPQTAKRELAQRELARRNLMDFAQYVAPWYIPARHQAVTAKYLEQVELFIRTRGKEGIGRLMIFWPPRHGKTQLVSKLFPAWLLGKLPDARIILTAYNADKAGEYSKGARDILNSERYRTVFGDLGSVETAVALSSDSRSVTAWDLAAPHRGGVVAAGVGGGLTGSGAHCLIIDDPIKNREEAESKSRRESIYEWYRSSAYTRLEDGGAIVVMHTRWHPDDLAGRLLKAMAIDKLADQWTILTLPAIWERDDDPKSNAERLMEGLPPKQEDLLGRKEGEALWPEKYNEDDLEHIKANLGPYEWAALYQQLPYSRAGDFFKREWFVIVEQPPAIEQIVRRVRYWDKAGTSGGGDYTAGVLMSVTKDGVYWVEHVVREQIGAALRDELIVETAKVDLARPGVMVEVWHQQDPGSAGMDSAMATNRRLAEAGAYAMYETVSGSKEVRAGPWATMCAAGNVRLVKAGWNADFIEEHAAFPKGHDDQVDAASGAFAKLAFAGGMGIYL